ncbi:hypothetical protein NDU88_001541 [Pleurodeles waltl]|uniref:Uncharacterized protein n=1 Tax=Pleurodeles waltl TaxID=8319 RepID=A0AAV7UT44_PLEWA|nr:hypothetical protein NDU88_001541 [Pleurodeles waltl]
MRSQMLAQRGKEEGQEEEENAKKQHSDEEERDGGITDREEDEEVTAGVLEYGFSPTGEKRRMKRQKEV